jgi:erythromycin esterase-like protein
LAPLGRMVANADIVGLGESIHTSGGFYAAKVRMIEYLIKEQGFREVAMESSWTPSEQVNEYVQTCSGTAEDAVRKFNPIWWDVTVAELLGWMCAWNTKNPQDKVTFSGFDIRQTWSDVPAVKRYLERVAPTEATGLAAGLSTCFGAGYADEKSFFDDPKVRQIYANESKVTDADHTACISGATAIKGLLATRKAEFAAATSPVAFERARLSVVSILAFDGQAYEYFGRDVNRGYTLRDEGMFEVFQSLRALRSKPSRTAIWAHNGHLSRKYASMVRPAYPNTVSLGTLLDQAYSARYMPIALVGYDVGYNWFDGPQIATFHTSRSVEKLLHTLAVTPAFVDLTTQANAPLLDPAAAYSLGSEQMVPAKHYAGLVYIDAPAGASYVGGTSPFAK